jgi:hypothetical protein
MSLEAALDCDRDLYARVDAMEYFAHVMDKQRAAATDSMGVKKNKNAPSLTAQESKYLEDVDRLVNG